MSIRRAVPPRWAPILLVAMFLLFIFGLLLTTPLLIMPPVLAVWAAGLKWEGVSSRWMNASALLAALLLIEWATLSLMAVYRLGLWAPGGSVPDFLAWVAFGEAGLLVLLFAVGSLRAFDRTRRLVLRLHA